MRKFLLYDYKKKVASGPGEGRMKEGGGREVRRKKKGGRREWRDGMWSDEKGKEFGLGLGRIRVSNEDYFVGHKD